MAKLKDFTPGQTVFLLPTRHNLRNKALDTPVEAIVDDIGRKYVRAAGRAFYEDSCAETGMREKTIYAEEYLIFPDRPSCDAYVTRRMRERYVIEKTSMPGWVSKLSDEDLRTIWLIFWNQTHKED